MRREHGHVVREREHPLAEGLVRRARELSGVLGAEKVDASDLPNEKSAAREEVLRIVGTPQVGYEIRDVLRRMSRRRDASDEKLAHFDRISVRVRCVRIHQCRARSSVDGDRAQVGEGARARDIVVVDVRLERVRDQDAETRGRGEVRFDLPVGIDQERHARVGVGDEVASVSKARVEELLDQQLARTLARVWLRSRLLTDRLGLLLEHFFAGTEVLFVRCDHRWNPLVDALALGFGLLE